MRRFALHPAMRLLLVAGALGAALSVQAQEPGLAADYGLTRPAFPGYADADLLPRGAILSTGIVRIAPALGYGGGGAGLSLEAGQQWFGRLTLGRSVESEGLSLGGGYRWRDGETLSMQVTRGLANERLGLAVRYDWPRYYLRVGYELRPRTGTADMLRFSAGIRF